MTSDRKAIAVTGASGLIGSRLVQVLSNEGHHLRILQHQSRIELPNSTSVNGDVCDPRAVSELLQGCKAAVHLAGVAHTSLESQAQIDAARAVNLGGTQNVFAAAKHAGIERIIVVSSAHVYAGQVGENIGEGSPTAADSAYASMKLAAEEVGLGVASKNLLDVIVARPCLTYGPGVRFNLESLLRAIHRGYYFSIRGINPRRSFLSVDNAAAALMHLLKAGESGKIYNLADREPMLLGDFVNLLADGMGVSRPRSLPKSLILTAIRSCAPLGWIGVKPPITEASLKKLTTSFTLDVSCLKSSGFKWSDDGHVARKQMVDSYLKNLRTNSA